MYNFKKSTEADFLKLYIKLDTIQKNVLYITHQVDFLRKKLIVDKGLQQQVDKYFEDDETSPQTDQDEQ